jgi:hypothetical protein
MVDAIIAILMSLQPFVSDGESPTERRARMEVISAAIVDAADRAACFGVWQTPDCVPRFRDRRGMAAALIVIGYAESRFARYVHENRCLDGPPGARCGADDRGIPRGRSPWQLWRSACPELWDRMVDSSLEATQAGAWCSARLLAGAYRRCQRKNANPWAGAFSGYRGASCSWPNAANRARLQRQFVAQL